MASSARSWGKILSLVEGTVPASDGSTASLPIRRQLGYTEGVTDEKRTFSSVDEYIDASTFDVEERLIQMRRIIRASAPDAEETISYNIPAYKADGLVVIQFAGFTGHTSLNFFPTAATFAKFEAELAPYKTSKSAIQLPLDKPLPVDLIEAIVRFRVAEATEYARRKRAGN